MKMETKEVQFIPFEKELLRIKEVVCVQAKKDGKPVVVNFTGNVKIVYQYMQDRYQFFKRSGKDFFDNQKEIAEACGVSDRTVIQIIQTLCEAGLVEKRQKSIKGAWHSNAYVVHDVFDTTMFQTGAKVDKGLLANRKVGGKAAQPPKPAKIINNLGEDLEDCPF